MDDHVVQCYVKAGAIAREARREAERIVKPGVRIVEVCERIEALIRERGAKPAFPVNVSVNEVAAHYTSPPKDKSRIPYPSVVKVDVGVQVDGYIADTAVTMVFADDPKLHDLAQAAEDALERVLELIEPKVKIRRLGEIVERTIKSYGFNPIRNLTGHSLDRYSLHAGTSIPNHGGPMVFGRLEAGRAYAIEPFATFGSGYVVDGGEATIYSIVKPERAKSKLAREIAEYVVREYGRLPFAERWLTRVAGEKAVANAVAELVKRRAAREYPVLVDGDGALVSQAEHTVLILEDEVIVTTL